MSARTPGPWRRDGTQVGPNGEETVYLVGGQDGEHPTLFVSSYVRGKRQREQFEANARLIAAAPDLLRAVTELLDDVPYVADPNGACECGEYVDYVPLRDESASCRHTRARAAIVEAGSR